MLLYESQDLTGTPVELANGRYKKADLKSAGVRNDKVNSMRVRGERCVTNAYVNLVAGGPSRSQKETGLSMT